jgi:hypothetical protein
MPRIKYNVKSIKRLWEEYNVSPQELAGFIGITRQAMWAALQKEYYPYRVVEDLSEFEEQIILEMIDEQVTDYGDVSLWIKIYGNRESCALLIKDDKNVRCIFKLPEDIEIALYEAGFHKYRDHDFEAIQILLKYSDEDKVVKITDPDDREQIKCYAGRSYYSSMTAYCRFLGFKYKHANGLTRHDICAKIERFLSPETNKVYIGSERSEYFWFTNRACHEGKPIEKWMKEYGYDYDRRGKEHKELRYKYFIEHYLVAKDNLIYIDLEEYDYFYNSLSNLASTRNMTIDELLNKWGYQRIDKKEYINIHRNLNKPA